MNVIEDFVEFEDWIDLTHVQCRIENWRYRIDGLYAQVSGWLPSSWIAAVDRRTTWRDPLFDRFGVPEQHLPILDIRNEGRTRGRLEPRALWILGANGRVDLALTPPTKHFVLADRADLFDPPRWRIHNLLAPQDVSLTREAFLDCFA